ncbi:alcohol dehydrogenase [Paramyrothecium foliicola]|nr:alcohol dehydrogenase [Paramyrothecium foliicola]
MSGRSKISYDGYGGAITHDHFDFGSNSSLNIEDVADEQGRSRVTSLNSQVSLAVLMGLMTDLCVRVTDILELAYPYQTVNITNGSLHMQKLAKVQVCKNELRQWGEDAMPKIFPLQGRCGIAELEQEPDLGSVMLHANILWIYYQSCKMALYNYELSVIMIMASDYPTSSLLGASAQVADVAFDGLYGASNDISECMGRLLTLGMARRLPSSIVGCTALPLAINMLEKKLLSSGNIEQSSLSEPVLKRYKRTNISLNILTSVMKLFADLNNLRIASASGSVTDRRHGFVDLAENEDIQYIVGDWMSEYNMTTRGGSKIDSKGTTDEFEDSFLEALQPALPYLQAKGIKVAVNAGASDTQKLHEAVVRMIQMAGLSLRVAWIGGDETIEVVKEALQAGHNFKSLTTGQKLSSWGLEPIYAQSYLGAWAIVEALNHGADIVLCGRVADASPTIGIAAHHFGWTRNDYDKLAHAFVAGHFIECSTYVTGGNFSGFKHLSGSLTDIGFPIVEMKPNGHFYVTKQGARGGCVTVDTYVVAVLDSIKIEEVGENRVFVHNVGSMKPPPTTKVGITAKGGYQAEAHYFLCGLDIEEKAKLLELQVRAGLDESKYHCLVFRTNGRCPTNPKNQDAATVDLRIFAQAKDPDDLSIKKFFRPLTDTIMQSYPGATFAVDARQAIPKPYYEYFVTILPQQDIKHVCYLPFKKMEVTIPCPVDTESFLYEQPSYETSDPTNLNSFGPTSKVPLGYIVHARSGDKGSDCNVGFFVRHFDEWDWLRSVLTVKVNNNKVEVNRIPIPTCGDNEILIKTKCATLCHSDLMLFWGHTAEEPPTDTVTIGHENTGYVVAMGSGVKNFKIGDAVGCLGCSYACYECEGCQTHNLFCKKGTGRMHGFTCDGHFAEYSKADYRNAMVLPQGMDMVTAAPLFCAGVTAYHAVKGCQLKEGQWVAIVGCGGLGHLAVQYAKAMKLRVIMFYTMENHDWEAQVKELTNGGCHAAAVFSASNAAYESSLKTLRINGLLMVAGIPQKPLTISALDILLGKYRIAGKSSGTPQNMTEAIQFSHENDIKAHIMIRNSINDIHEIIDTMNNGKTGGRFGIVL